MTALSRQLGNGSFTSFDLNLPTSPSNVSLLSMTSTGDGYGKEKSSRIRRRNRKSSSLPPRKAPPEPSRWQSDSLGNAELAVDPPRRKKSNPFLLDAQLVVPRRKRSNPNLLQDEELKPCPNVAFPRREKADRDRITRTTSHDSALMEPPMHTLRYHPELLPAVVRVARSSSGEFSRKNSCRT